MLALDGYSLKQLTRTHDDLHLYRGLRLLDNANVLVHLAVRAAPCMRLQHAYDVRADLAPGWALQTLEFIKTDTRAMLVQLDPGGELLENLLGPPMPISLFLRLALGMAHAVAELHRCEIVHKEIQPTHMLIDLASGQTRLLGFGNASRIPREQQEPLPLEVISGNFAYMAPELTGRVNRSIDSRSDLYALGVCFYQMLSGVLPFSAKDAIGWVHSHIARQALAPHERVATLPLVLSRLVMKLLEKNAEERYQTAQGLIFDLQQIAACLAGGASGIDDFALARQDDSGRLTVPEKLYGREQSRQVLLDAVDQVLASGTPELVLVSGYSGIGKSSLVHELHQVLVEHRARFIIGKFDQHKRNIPYSTLAQTFQLLVQQMLGHSRAELDAWRDAILQAVGSNGQLLLDLIPELQFVIGPQPACVELAPNEAQNRFQAVFSQFLLACTSSEHPLIVFLDDWQWMDVASQRLISDLLSDSGVRNFLLIGAYSDNELTATDPLLITLDALRHHAVIVKNILLGPLLMEDVQQLLMDTLHADAEYCAPLTHLVYEKTAGNPFFTTQFLNRLADEKLLSFDFATRRWQWDLARIEEQGYSQNVIDLMVAKLQRLPQTCLDVVKMLACLGHGVAAGTLAKVCKQSLGLTEAALWPALKLGLVLHKDTRYQFAHDRVQEAAYLFTPQQARAQVHLDIARLLLAQLSPQAIEDDIFNIVGQFNLGSHLIERLEERTQLSHLNFLAGKKAKDAVAYAAARGYLMAASQLQPDDAWQSNYAQCFALHLALAECEYLTGRFEYANQLFQLISQHAQSKLDSAKVATLRGDLYQLSGQFDRAVETGLETLHMFGVSIPQNDDEIGSALAQELANVDINMRGRSPSELIHLPAVVDPAIAVVISCFADMASPIQQIRAKLFALLTAKTLNFILHHGNANGASMAYTSYAIILMENHEIERAVEFSELSMAVGRKFHDVKRSGIFEYCHGVYFHSWRKSMQSNLPLLEHAFIACVDAGNFFWAGYCTFAIPWFHFDTGAKLEDVRRVLKKYMEFAQYTHNRVAVQMDTLLLQACACLQGMTRAEDSFNDEQYDEQEAVALFDKAFYFSGICIHHILKQLVAVVYGQPQAGLRAAAAALPLLPSVKATMLESTHVFLHGLAASAAWFEAGGGADGAPDGERTALRKTVFDCMQKMQLWAAHCPDNFANRHALLAAELARIDGRHLEAMDWYDASIASAHDHGFVQYEALANERAAQFFFARGSEKIARTYLRDARHAYLRWGAHGKVRQLDRRFPGLHSRRGDGAKKLTQSGTRVDHLDLMSVIKASQAVSADIVLDHLIEALLRIVLEHAGADRALLLMPQNGEMQIAAMADAVDEQISVVVHPHLENNALPRMVVNYCARVQDKVLLEDCTAAHAYAHDPYWRSGRAKSMLCLPLVKQATLVGVLYMENTLVPGAFNHGRIAVIELLASQAAISLENAVLFTNLAREQSTIRELNASLEQRVQERTGELQRALMEQKAILDNAHTGISIVREHHILRCNLGQELMLGYAPGELVGRSTRIMFANDAAMAAFSEKAYPNIASGNTWEQDVGLVRKDGSEIWCSLYGKAIDAKELWLGTVWVMQDISDRKLTEQKLLEHADALQKTINQLHETQLQLVQQEKMASIGTLTAGIAHEINNPAHFANLGAFNARDKLGRFHQFLLSLTGPDAPPVLLDKIKQHVQELNADLDVVSEGTIRIRDLVRDLRTFSRLDEADFKVVPIADSLNSTVNLVRTQYQETAQIRLELDANPELECNPAQLNQVFMNLIINACQAIAGKQGTSGTNQPGVLVIRTRLDGDGVVFEFEDNGCGMPQEVADQIFDPFFTTKSVGEGMGMGLSISFGIIKKHHGTIAVHSSVGQGTCFTLRLPLHATKTAS